MFSRIRENLSYKLLALLCACALRWYVWSQQNPPVQTPPATPTIISHRSPSSSLKELMISPMIAGTPGVGYKIAGVQTNPSTESVIGHVDQLTSLSALNTAPIYIEGATGDIVKPAAGVIPTGVTLVDPKPIIVTVHIVPIENKTTATPVSPH